MRPIKKEIFLYILTITLITGCATNKNLNDALRNHDYDVAMNFLNTGADVNEEQPYSEEIELINTAGYTPICFASKYNFSIIPDLASKHHAVIQKLIKNGAKLNVKCDGWNSPLDFAAMMGDLIIVKLLVENGANPNQAPNSLTGQTPLKYAYTMGHLDVANYLIKKGATGGEKAIKHYYVHLENLKQAKLQIAREEEARQEKLRQERAESRDFWKGAATLATGVVVGNATRNLSSDQQTRMMKSSMEAVDSGDASGFSETTRQVKAEQAQSHQAKMREIEAEKARERAAQRSAERSSVSRSSQPSAASNSHEEPYKPKIPPLNFTEHKKYRCVQKSTGSALKATESAAREQAMHYAKIVEGGMGNRKTISSGVTSCKPDSNGYKCYAETRFEVDSANPCSSGGPSGGRAK